MQSTSIHGFLCVTPEIGIRRALAETASGKAHVRQWVGGEARFDFRRSRMMSHIYVSVYFVRQSANNTISITHITISDWGIAHLLAHHKRHPTTRVNALANSALAQATLTISLKRKRLRRLSIPGIPYCRLVSRIISCSYYFVYVFVSVILVDSNT